MLNKIILLIFRFTTIFFAFIYLQAENFGFIWIETEIFTSLFWGLILLSIYLYTFNTIMNILTSLLFKILGTEKELEAIRKINQDFKNKKSEEKVLRIGLRNVENDEDYGFSDFEDKLIEVLEKDNIASWEGHGDLMEGYDIEISFDTEFPDTAVKLVEGILKAERGCEIKVEIVDPENYNVEKELYFSNLAGKNVSDSIKKEEEEDSREDYEKLGVEKNFLHFIKGFSLGDIEVIEGDCDDVHFESEENLRDFKKRNIFACKIYFDYEEKNRKFSEAINFLKDKENIFFCINDAEENLSITFLYSEKNDKYDLLRFMGTNALNYEMGVESIIKKMEDIDTRFNIECFFNVEDDGFGIQIKKLPTDVLSFASEIYDFCPDIVDQGVGNKENLAKMIEEERKIYFWWD